MVRKFDRLLKSAGAAALLAVLPGAAFAQNLMDVSITEAGNSVVSQTLVLPLNKSAVVELGRPAADVIVSNPEVADVFVQTSQRLIFRGVATGKTNAFIFDRNGNQIVNLEITVEQDVADLEQMIRRLVPEARVAVEGINGNVVLTGRVPNLSQADRVLQITKGYLANQGINRGVQQAGETQIVNLMSVDANDQVMLQVRIVEMQRSVVKQLGINISGEISYGELASQTVAQLFSGGVPLFVDAAGAVTTNPNGGTPFVGTVAAAPWSNNATFGSTNNLQVPSGLSLGSSYQNYVGDDRQFSIGAGLDALERVGLVKTLAEPTLSAVSGESANFLAGGEFPVPVGQDENGRITIEFKQFGVGLAFTPVVLSEDRISLKVSTEVSELTNEGAFQQQSASGVNQQGQVVNITSTTIPALKVRRTETTVELPSGQSMMVAGLIQADTRQILEGIPGAKDIPVLGALFRSRDFLSEETELVVIFTPYLVDPANPNKLRTPADGYANAADTETNLFGRLNAVYGKGGRPVDGTGYSAPVGFIEE